MKTVNKNPRIIAFGKAKGGSGATTVGGAFAVQLARLGRNVAVVDLDVNAKITWALLEGERAPGFYNWFGAVPCEPDQFTPDWIRTRFQYNVQRARPNLDLWVLPGDPMTLAAESVATSMRWPETRLKDMLRSLTCYDYILLDGPDTGSLPRMGLIAADMILAFSALRVIDQESIEILASLIGSVRDDNPTTWIVPNRYDGRVRNACDPLLADIKSAVTQAQEAGMDWRLCDPIGEAVALDTALKLHRTLPEVRPSHPVARQITALAKQVDDYFFKKE